MPRTFRLIRSTHLTGVWQSLVTKLPCCGITVSSGSSLSWSMPSSSCAIETGGSSSSQHPLWLTQMMGQTRRCLRERADLWAEESLRCWTRLSSCCYGDVHRWLRSRNEREQLRERTRCRLTTAELIWCIGKNSPCGHLEFSCSFCIERTVSTKLVLLSQQMRLTEITCVDDQCVRFN